MFHKNQVIWYDNCQCQVPLFDPIITPKPISFFAGLFLTLLLFTQLGRFAKLRFFLSWWAYSFPVAAITIASLLMYEHTGTGVYLYIGGGLLLILTGVVALLLARTISAVGKHGICVPEH
jgi:tellurite resistance protein